MSSYDHPNCLIRREFATVTTPGAGAVSARFATFQKIRMEAVHAIVVVAGTATNNGFALMRGTDTLAVLPLGTTTAGGHFSGVVHETIDEFGTLSIKNGSDGAAVAAIIYEYTVKPDAVQT